MNTAFNNINLDEIFKNLRVGTSPIGKKYILSGSSGDIAELLFLETGEWRFFIDNFPGSKKYYNTNFPFVSAEEFISDIKRIGLTLELKD